MEDRNIIQLYWDRDERAIFATAEKYGQYCFSIAKNILDSREDAEECVNDTYLQTWKTIPPHAPLVLSTFLGKITRNLSINRYKHNTAEKRGGGTLSVVLEELSELLSDTEDAADIVYKKELISAINAFLGTLSPEKRSIFVSRYWYADSIADIAARYGRTEGSVSMVLNRLRKQLHENLTERGFV